MPLNVYVSKQHVTNSGGAADYIRVKLFNTNKYSTWILYLYVSYGYLKVAGI